MNLAAAAFGSVGEANDPTDIADFIIEISNLVEQLDPADVARDINEDRAVSGFAEVRALDQVEVELADRKRHVRNCIRDTLDQMWQRNFEVEDVRDSAAAGEATCERRGTDPTHSQQPRDCQIQR